MQIYHKKYSDIQLYIYSIDIQSNSQNIKQSKMYNY